MEFKAVYIEWEDSICFGSRWQSSEDVKEDAKHENFCHELGFIIEETDTYILLSSRYLIVSEDEEIEPDVGYAIKIPKSLIRKRKEINLK